ncbi:MAG: energy transducer TonB [Bacteroidales bacterium]|nr:energy transducer TonB [Bacteroidales bacterium]
MINKEKKFPKLPKYPGGKTELKKFILKNLKYPDQALKKKIEGIVYIKYKVNALGEVISTNVIKGIGYGCDEEAIRLCKLLKYEKAKNRGIRIVSTIRSRIVFKLPANQTHVSYQYKKSENRNNEKKNLPNEKQGNSYSYTINL